MCRVIVMGACPHDDHAQFSNWGIFNQHIWGDYNQHSQLSLIKRLREIAWGLPSLVAWQVMEMRWVRPDPAKDMRLPHQS